MIHTSLVLVFFFCCACYPRDLHFLPHTCPPRRLSDLIVLILPHLNPPASAKQAGAPGNLIVHVSWPEGDADVDLWLDGPAEPVPVGYSNKGGVLWNLLRDDLGTKPDATPLNYENAFTRGVVPGEYTINVHCFRCPTTPVQVDVEISLKPDEIGRTS